MQRSTIDQLYEGGWFHWWR